LNTEFPHHVQLKTEPRDTADLTALQSPHVMCMFVYVTYRILE